MKNKKLFAILTLVCFMFTLMPVAAFAADPTYVKDQVYVGAGDNPNTPNVTEKTIDPATDIEVMAARPFDAKVAASTSALSKEGLAFYAVDADGKGVAVTTNGQLTIKLPGDYQVFAVKTAGNNVAKLFANANDILEDETPATAVAKVQAALDAQIVKAYATVTVVAPEAKYVVAFNEAGTLLETKVTVKADNGFSNEGNKQVKVRLTNNTKAVVGKAPEITAPDYVTVVPVSAKKVVTDANGYITYNISASRGGDFEVVFGYEDAEEAVLKVEATDDVVANVELVQSSANAINKTPVKKVFNTGAVLKFTDVNGSVKDVVGNTDAETGLIDGVAKVTVISQPANSKLTGKDFGLVASKAVTGGYDLVVNSDNDLKVGSYEVKVSLANGKAVTAEFEAAKMGDVVGIRFVNPAKTVALNGSLVAANFTVQAYDANGVVSKLEFDPEKTTDKYYTLVVSGKALDKVVEGKIFNVQDEEKYIGSTITVLAKTGDDKFIATTTVEVVEAGQEVVYKTNTAEVGVTTKLTANVLDAKGNKVAVGAEKENVRFVVLEKPAKAYVNVEATAISDANDITVTFLASVAGEYKIQTIVLVDNNEYVTGIETITVGNNEAGFKDVVVVSLGADKMIVNNEVVALDVAPFIENNRTMMQYNVLYVFGIDVQWDGVNSVIAEGNGIKVVMTIGSKVAVVNGEEVALDVAPYVVNGRTVVPVGFITGVLDITPTFTYNADGSIADILFAK